MGGACGLHEKCRTADREPNLISEAFSGRGWDNSCKGYHQKYYKELLKFLDFPDIHFHQLRNIALMRREFHIYWDIPRKSFL